MVWDDILGKIVINVISALIVGVAGFSVWRSQTVFKRRFEVAEEALMLFSQLESEFWNIRNPWFIESGDETVPKEYQSNASIYLRLQQAVEDIRASKDVRDKIPAMTRLCAIHLGKEASNSFTVIDASFIRVAFSVAEFLRLLREPITDPKFKEKKDRFEAIVYSDVDDKHETATPRDELGAKIIATRKKLEAVCNRYHAVGPIRRVLGLPN